MILEDNVEEWTGNGFRDSLSTAKDSEIWKGFISTLSVLLRRL